MISFEEALETVLAHAPIPESRQSSLEQALGAVLMETITSDIPMPPFHRSAVDGYALPGPGSIFPLDREITASPGTPEPLSPGHAAPIMTGAPVPEGADRIVMIEFTCLNRGNLQVRRMPSRGENICFQGEDVARGSVVLRPGTVLSPAALGVAAMAGRSSLLVARKPMIALMTTGDEVISPDRIPGPGEIRNANGVLGCSLLSAAGFGPVSVCHSPDSPEALKEAAAAALEGADVLLVAGGVSMGTRDFVPSVMKELGFRFLFEGVAQKPGKPLCFAVRNGKTFFGLPGNPVSVLVALEEVVIPFLRKSSGFTRFRKKRFTGRMAHDLRKKPGRTQFFRATAVAGEPGFLISVPETRGSGDLMSAVAANCLVVLSEGSFGASRGEEAPFSFLGSFAGETVFS